VSAREEGDPRRTREEPQPEGTGRFGLYVFLGSLTMLFGASILSYLLIRANAASWPPPNAPALPWAGLLFSTVVILAASATIQWALGSIRAGNAAGLRTGLAATCVLSLVFLVSQYLNWVRVLPGARAAPNLHSFIFYVLTGLHALHVLGGLVVLGVVTSRAWRGAYTARLHAGVSYATLYWHYLDVVWIVMFLVLFVF